MAANVKRVTPLRNETSGEVEGVRQRILRTARELFYREGVRAIGVDRIVAESGVAKTSLYRWFPSKDDLITAFLEAEEAASWAWWDGNAERTKDSPREQLRLQLSSIEKHITHPQYRGCAFDNVCTEFADEHHPARAVARRFKEETVRRLVELARALGSRNPEVLGSQLALLVDGAYGSAQVLGKNGPAGQLIAAADALVDVNLAVGEPRRAVG